MIRGIAKEVPEVLTRPPNGRSVSEYEYFIDIVAEAKDYNQDKTIQETLKENKNSLNTNLLHYYLQTESVCLTLEGRCLVIVARGPFTAVTRVGTDSLSPTLHMTLRCSQTKWVLS